MNFEIRGFAEMERRLNRLQTAARGLSKTHRVELSELLSPSFLKSHTDFESFEAMVEASGFKVDSQEDFRAIPDDAWDAFVSARTRFVDWEAMLQAAAEDYARRRLGL